MFAKNDGKRKWQCFVCGREYLEYQAFADHIVEEHEEGRDYVRCPLPRCAAPIRDIQLHMKAKHPHDSMPSFHGPNRALVWKGQKGVKEKKSKRPTFRQGEFVSMKNNGKEFTYRSSYECAVLECLELLPEIVKYDVEPIRIPYFYKGQEKNYIPDISLCFSDGHIEIWEIKPANQTSLEQNTAKWDAAKLFCATRGWDFIVITEKGIELLKKEILLRANHNLQ